MYKNLGWFVYISNIAVSQPCSETNTEMLRCSKMVCCLCFQFYTLSIPDTCGFSVALRTIIYKQLQCFTTFLSSLIQELLLTVRMFIDLDVVMDICNT